MFELDPHFSDDTTIDRDALASHCMSQPAVHSDKANTYE